MSGSTVLLLMFWTAFGLIAYTYVFFPLLLAVLARLFGSRQTELPGCGANEELPKVAMIIAAYNEQEVLTAKLANTWSLDYPADKFEILIGSDGSNDRTTEILKSCSDNRLRTVAFADRRGKISVLNDLLKLTVADVIVMSDANTMFAPDAIRKLVAHFADERVGCVSGKLTLEQDGGVSGEGIYWKYEGWIKHNESRLGFLIGCNGGIYALRRVLYDPLPESTIIEDFVLTLRVIEKGYLVRLEPRACATEPACATARAEMVRKIRIGAGGWQALGLTRSVLSPRFGAAACAFWGHKVLRWMVPHFYLVGVTANIALVLGSYSSVPFYAWCLAAQICGAFVAVAAFRSGGRSFPKWSRPISYFYLMNYALALGFLRYLFRTQRVTWERGVGRSQTTPSELIAAVGSNDNSTIASGG
jgi:cellulose synthase/poly-beta-1,6-N-acetylglucosamine synthase-like glycosyltransferase